MQSALPVAAPWVAEGAGIPVTKSTLGNIVVGPARKLGTITAWTEELDRISGAAMLFEQILRENIAAALDLAYFSSTAASAAAHAGLLAGVTPLTASAAGGVAAAQSDLAALAAAVSGPGSSGEVVFALSRANAATLPLALPQTTITVLGTDAADRRPGRRRRSEIIVHATDSDPEVSASKNVTLHMSDTPLPLATGPQGSGLSRRPRNRCSSREGRVADLARCGVCQAQSRRRRVDFRSGLECGAMSDEHNRDLDAFYRRQDDERTLAVQSRPRPRRGQRLSDREHRVIAADYAYRLDVKIRGEMKQARFAEGKDRVVRYTQGAADAVHRAISMLISEMEVNRIRHVQARELLEDRVAELEGRISMLEGGKAKATARPKMRVVR